MLQHCQILAINFAEYASTIVKGVGFGVTLSFVAGPAMFALIQTSLTNGFKAGVHLALGISLSDIFMVFLTLFGISSLMDNPQSRILQCSRFLWDRELGTEEPQKHPHLRVS